MATTKFISGPIGAGPTRHTVSKEFELGTPALGNDNTTWVYAQASIVVTATTVVAVSQSTFLIGAGTGYTCDTAFAINEYGWIRKTTSPIA